MLTRKYYIWGVILENTIIIKKLFLYSPVCWIQVHDYIVDKWLEISCLGDIT